MKKHRILSILAGTLLSAAVLAGCGEEGDSRGRIDEEAEEEETEEEEAKPTQAADEQKPEAEPTQAPEATPTEAPAPVAAVDSDLIEFSAYQYGNNYYDEEKDRIIAEVETTHLRVLSDGYPELKAAVEAYSMEGENLIYGEGFDSFKEMAIDTNKEEFWAEGGVCLYSESNTSVIRGDSVVTSLLTYKAEFMGGAHGSYNYYPKNYDSRTGEELILKDVLQEGQDDKLPALLEECLLEEYERDIFFDADSLEESIAESYSMVGNLNFTLGYEEITFYFQTYDLAPYASGAQIICLRYEDYPDLVKEEYISEHKDYVVSYEACNCRLPGSDTSFSFYTVSDGGEGELGQTVHILVDDEEFEDSIIANDTVGWIMHIGGVDYLYLECSGYGSYGETHIYNLTPGHVEKCGIVPAVFLETVPMDPMFFRLYERTEVISTIAGYKHYYVGRDGMPVTADDAYVVYEPEWGIELTLKQDLETEVWDSPDMKSSVTETLPEGTRFEYYDTDGETGAGLILEDGRYIQLEIDDPEGWPRTINGTDVEELFDGIIFAG